MSEEVKEKVGGIGARVLSWIDGLPGPSRAYTVGLAVVVVAALLLVFFIL